ncbi:hypothetical protein GCM10007108_16410 [Thermogymnomonas acidicola]|uniref:Tetratricopeptide repeat protein n=2 Tax=Thermogymnomonas acidicola TaxID=399579 RepID=A0AA37BSM8_9ARCH|nr:hypothetical protein GCM10007108_16410 [Thermogymnomonas acidicola]
MEEERCIVLTGGPGWGAQELVDMLVSGEKHWAHRPYYDREILKYAPYNRLLDRLTGRHEQRELDVIIRTLETIRWDGWLVTNGLDMLSDHTKHFFVYLSRNTSRFHVRQIATANSLSSGFSSLLGENSDRIGVVELSRPTDRDVVWYLRERFRDMPGDLVSAVARVSNRNFDAAHYVLGYLSYLGILRDDGTVNLGLYRHFTIPPDAPTLASRIVSHLGDGARQLLLALYISGREYRRVELEAAFGEGFASAVGDLSRLGLARDDGGEIAFNKGPFGDRIVALLGRDAYVRCAQWMVQAGLMNGVPLQARLVAYLRSGNSRALDAEVRENWRLMLRRFTSLTDLMSFIESAMPMVTEESRKLLQTMRCTCLYNSYRYGEALQCFESIDGGSEGALAVADMLIEIGGYKRALETALEVLESERGALAAEASGLCIRALLESGNYREALDASKSALSSRIEDRQALGEITRLKGLAEMGLGMLESAISDLRVALGIFEESFESKGITSTLIDLATAHLSMLDLEGSEEFCRKAIENSFLLGEAERRLQAYSMMVRVCGLALKAEECMEYAVKAQALCNSLGLGGCSDILESAREVLNLVEGRQGELSERALSFLTGGLRDIAKTPLGEALH